ncbi:MAG: lytic transglycosylase domain-containing protein [Desulfobacteraceae bacterium]
MVSSTLKIILGQTPWPVFILALLFTVLCGNASATSLRLQLEMLGYKSHEIEAILSGRASKSEVDWKIRRQMVCLPVTTSRAVDSNRGRMRSDPKDRQKARDGSLREPGRIHSREDKPVVGKIALESRRLVKHPSARTRVTPDLSLPEKTLEFLPIIHNVAEKTRVDKNLIMAVIKVESDFDPAAISPKGAMGLMQLMPTTATSLGLANPFDPEQNIHGGARYLAQCIDMFQDTKLALAAYNAGPHLVNRLQTVPPYPETRRFVQDVFYYKKLYDRSSISPEPKGKRRVSGG